MKIKSKLTIVILFIIFASIVFSLLIHFSLNRYTAGINKATVANQIVSKVFGRRLLADDYLFNPGERARKQWYIQDYSLEQLINANANKFNSSAEKELLSSIEDSLRHSKETFEQVIALNENDASSSALQRDKKNSLATQLTVKAQEVILSSSKLAEINNKNSAEALQQIIFLFSAAALLFLLLLLVSFWLIWQGANKIDESNIRFNFVSQATNDVVWDWNLVTDIIFWNEQVTTLFGYAKSDVLPLSAWWTDHIHPDDVNRVNDSIQAALDGADRYWKDEYRFKKKNGEYAYINDRGYIIRNSSEKPIRMIGAMQDITIRKLGEEEIIKQKDEVDKFNRLMVDRELKMVELKKEIEELKNSKE